MKTTPVIILLLLVIPVVNGSIYIVERHSTASVDGNGTPGPQGIPGVAGTNGSNASVTSGHSYINITNGVVFANLTAFDLRYTSLTFATIIANIGNWSADKSSYSTSIQSNTLYVRNATIPTCSGTDKLTSAGNGVLTCATDQTGGAAATSWTNWTSVEYATTSNTVYVYMNNLTVTLASNTHYVIECQFITFAAAATTGEQLRVNTTGSPSVVTWTFNSQVSATARTSFQGVNTATNAFADTGSAGTNVRDNTLLTGYIKTNGNPVTVKFEMKSEISASNAAYNIGSRCTYEVVT